MPDSRMSKESFRQMAAAFGVDMRDSEYLDRIYDDALAVLRIVSLLDEADVTGIEPAAMYGTGYGPAGEQRMGP
ncbi:MAG: hypothetical protein FJ318_05685 [SAR202 cluster bacterium]|nr:hypothetical protein [SAR202 cluster bacterium]